MNAHILACTFLALFASVQSLHAQTDTTITPKEGAFDRIFGFAPNPLHTIGVDTVKSIGKYDIVIKDNCTMKAIDDNGETIWSMRTAKFGCTHMIYEYLDEDVMAFLDELPLEFKCDMNRQLGEGDKLILRKVAKMMGVMVSLRVDCNVVVACETIEYANSALNAHSHALYLRLRSAPL